MARKEASDLHLKPMRPPLLRIRGKLVPVKAEPLKPADLEEMLLGILTPAQKQRLEQNQSVDIGYGLQGVARFRANFYIQRGSLAAAFRRIPYQIRRSAELGLPEIVETFARFPSGMVLLTGPTGSGKSTTLAAILQTVIETRPSPSSRSRTRSNTSSPTTRSPSAKSARTRRAFRGAPETDAAGPGRDHGRRNAGLADDPDRRHGRRDRAPRVLDTAHQQRRPVHRPHHRRVPPRPAAADAVAARPGPESDRFAAADRQVRRVRPDARLRGHDQFPQDRQAHRAGRDQGDPAGDRVVRLVLPHAVHEPVLDRPARQRPDHVPESDGDCDGPRRPVPKLGSSSRRSRTPREEALWLRTTTSRRSCS